MEGGWQGPSEGLEEGALQGPVEGSSKGLMKVLRKVYRRCCASVSILYELHLCLWNRAMTMVLEKYRNMCLLSGKE